MENEELKSQDEMWQRWEKEHKRGKILGGIVIVAAGGLFLARELGVVFPAWLFTWKILLIVVGLLGALKHGFRGAGWLIPVAVGVVYLIPDLYPEIAIRPLILPVIVILVGLAIILKPQRSRKQHHNHWRKWQMQRERHKAYYEQKYNEKYNYEHYGRTETTNDDTFDSVAFMGSIKKNILSKHFRSGDITAVFGGAKVDFSHADIDQSAVLEVTDVFAGTQLVIPAHWEIRSEIVCVFGNVEDKRPQQPVTTSEENRKVLILRGTIFFGGLEIKSFT